MSKLTIIANIVANSDKIDLVKTELEKLIPITRLEDGCLQYDLHQDTANPAHFLFVENWESGEALQAHKNKPHLAAFMAATKGAVETFTVQELTQIG